MMSTSPVAEFEGAGKPVEKPVGCREIVKFIANVRLRVFAWLSTMKS